MKKLFSLTLLALVMSFASFAQVDPIFGNSGCCVGSDTYVFDSTSGGAWSSSNTAVAIVGSAIGYEATVYGVSAGTCTITYTYGGVYATWGFTVSPAPVAIVSASTVCTGSSITCSDAVTGGTWSSSAPTIATVGSSTGVVSALTTGTTSIEYLMGPGCYVYKNVTVLSTPAPAAITGSSSVCVGSTIALADATLGGVWSSTTPTIAVVGTGTGVVTGISTGTSTISYTVTGACGSASATKVVTVTSTVSAGTITGSGAVTVGSATTLSDGVGGGTWTSSNTSIATVGASSGIVTGVAAGTATITYTVTGCGGTAYTTFTVTVSAAPPVNIISGNILFTGSAVDSSDTIKVWLIHYDPSTHLLTAIDSMITFTGGTSAYYHFAPTVTDSYRVKAAYYAHPFSSTGYIPTYYSSAYYWHDATVIYHTYPSTDAGKDITMGYGTVTAGPGFIGGDVTTGANKGTSGTIPTVNLLVYVLNAGGTILQQTYTDAAGHYSFTNLPVGVYTVYPEDINYNTTAYTGINITATADSFKNADFGQHTISKTILPGTTGIQNVTSSISSVVAFPNPTNGKLNIQWNEGSSEKANVTITDITGRVVYTSAINMNQGSGNSQIDISSLTSGVYMISVKSGTINYNNKIELQH